MTIRLVAWLGLILPLVLAISGPVWAVSEAGSPHAVATPGGESPSSLADATDGSSTGVVATPGGESLRGVLTHPRNLAAVVNGQPIEQSAVELVLKLGAFPYSTGEWLKYPVTEQILEQLILEQLILDAATQRYLKVSPEEIATAFRGLDPEQTGIILTGAEQSDVKKVLKRQLMVRKLTEVIMSERQVMSAEEWQKYWSAWPKTKVPRYQVRVLLIPLTVDVSKLNLHDLGDLEAMEQYFADQNILFLPTGPIWLAGPDQSPDLVAALDKAFALGKMTEARRLQESWGIYEVLQVERESAPLEDYQRARGAFESLAREKAFRNWLTEKRVQADVKFAPFGN